MAPGRYRGAYTAWARLDLSDASLWLWETHTTRVWRYPSIGLDSAGLPAWDWQAGQGIEVPGLVFQAWAEGPFDFRPVRDAAGPALYVWSTERGEPDEDYYLRRYALADDYSSASLSWERRTGPYQIYNRDRYMGQILASGRDGEWNRPVSFAVPPLSRFLFLGYNTGLQVEAVDVSTGEGVALLRDDSVATIWLDTQHAVQAMYLPKARGRDETYIVTVTDNYSSRIVIYRWTPPKAQEEGH
jgi:hypothetical protein